MLVLYINSSVTCLKFAPKFLYHSNRKSWINARLLHFGYCSNKLIRRNMWKSIFIFDLIGGQNSLLMHVPLWDSYAPETIILKTRSEVKVTLTRK